MADREHALSHLYTRLMDSKHGYEQALQRAESPYIKGVFTDMIDRRSRNAMQIKQFLSGMGHETSDDGSTLAAAHRAFLSLKDRVTGHGDEAVLQEVLRGEESLDKAYHEALDAAGPTDPEHAFLREQHETLKGKIDELQARAKTA